MLFNSLLFLLLFLPLVVLGYRGLLVAGRPVLVLGWLTLASLCFYAAWAPAFVGLLLVHVAVNGTLARFLPNRGVFVFGVVANLAVLGLFKYAGFLAQTVNQLTAIGLPSPGWVLPVGISFFTFTQIAFLADVQRGLKADRSPLRYLLFVTWFPHLVAGPVIHHAQVMPQLERAARRPPRPLAVQAGLALFVLGLAKKVLLADSLAGPADAAFEAARQGTVPDIASAWSGVLAYTLQLYFDFSGYSDMACGLSLMFGVRLPLNFYSPYRAVGIIEFWRRWHMTLSRFLRDYLYIPLGGRRCSPTRHRFNLMATMVLGGLWHGASWNFVLWGALHGVMLVLHQAWRALSPWRVPAVLAVPLTFLLVAWAWIPFRAADLETAARLWWALWDPATFAGWPAWWAHHAQQGAALSSLQGAVEALTRAPVYNLRELALGAAVPLIALGILVVWALPNTAQIMGPLVEEARNPVSHRARRRRLRMRWRPNTPWALALGGLLGLCLLNLNRQSPFLYFQF